MAVHHQLSPLKADHQLKMKVQAEKIAVIADVGPLTKIAAVAGIEATAVVVAVIEAAAVGFDNRAADEVTNRVDEAIIDRAARANAEDLVLTIHRRWKNRWKLSPPSLMKN